MPISRQEGEVLAIVTMSTDYRVLKRTNGVYRLLVRRVGTVPLEPFYELKKEFFSEVEAVGFCLDHQGGSPEYFKRKNL